MSEHMVRQKPMPRQPGEMSEFDLDILGRSAVRINIPVQNVVDTLEALRLLRRVAEHAIVRLEHSKIEDDRHTLFEVKSLLRGVAQTIYKVKRRRF